MDSDPDNRSHDSQPELQESNSPRSKEDKRSCESQQETGPSKRRRTSQSAQDQATIERASSSTLHQHDQSDETEASGTTTTAAQNHSPIVHNEPDQLTQDESQSDRDSSSGLEWGSESDLSTGSSESHSENESGDESSTEDVHEDAGSIVEEITADDEQETTIEEIVPDNAEDGDNDDSKRHQEPATVPVAKSATPTSEPSVVPDASGSSSATRAPSTTTTTATTINPPHEFVDQSIRRPANGLFFTREAYEAYSVDSIHNIVERHIKWIQENREEATAMYNEYMQTADQEREQPAAPAAAQGKEAPSSSSVNSPVNDTNDTHTTTTTAEPGTRKPSRTPSISSAAGTPKASSPASPPSNTTAPPPPSSTSTAATPQEERQKKEEPIDLLDGLLSSIKSEKKSSSPPLASSTEHQAISKPTMPPSDVAVAAAASSSTAPQYIPQSNVFLGDGVHGIYKSLCKLDRKRIQHYPQHYSHHSNLTARTPDVRGKVPVLEFKKNIAMFGKIATTTATGTYPQKIDMKKNYTQDDSSSDDTQEYYRKKLPPTVSRDPVIASILTNNKIDIAITMDTLSKLIELPNNVFLEFEIPIVVRDNENGNKTLFMDQPLLHDKVDTHNQNQIAYDLAFKSNRLNWKARQSLEMRSETELKEDCPKNYREDENIRYDVYTLGNQSILLQRQQDALLEGIQNSNKQTYLTTALHYNKDRSQNQHLDLLKFPNTRTKYWLQSYVSGHGKILEGQIHVATNQLVGMRYLHMRNIMANWAPSRESAFLQTLLSDLYTTLETGKTYILRKNKDTALSIFESTSPENSDFDLYHAYPSENKALH